MPIEVVAGRVAEAEEARTLRRDATAMVERMAVRARAAGLEHPVAASVTRSARVSRLAGPEDFAERLGVPVARLVEAESGIVRFGDLPIELDSVLGTLDIDLLSLADLEREWQVTEAVQGHLS
jgi:imidazoleglycerol phosphate dehydratase HisB